MKAKFRISRVQRDGDEKIIISKDHSEDIVEMKKELSRIGARTKRPWIVNVIKDFLERYASHKRTA